MPHENPRFIIIGPLLVALVLYSKIPPAQTSAANPLAADYFGSLYIYYGWWIRARNPLMARDIPRQIPHFAPSY